MSIDNYVLTKVSNVQLKKEINKTVVELQIPKKSTIIYIIPFCINLANGDILTFKNPNFESGLKILSHEDYEAVRIYDPFAKKPVYCEFKAEEFLN